MINYWDKIPRLPCLDNRNGEAVQLSTAVDLDSQQSIDVVRIGDSQASVRKQILFIINF